MSDSATIAEPGPSYFLAVEIALAVATTLLALYFCKGKTKGATPTSDDENVTVVKGSKSTDLDEQLEEGPRVRGSDSSQRSFAEENDNSNQVNEEIYHHGPGESNITAAAKTFDTKATQTDVNGERKGKDDTDLQILWKAVIVNAHEHQKTRYRTELNVDVDGVISHSESLQREGIAGMGMQQVLVKVQ